MNRMIRMTRMSRMTCMTRMTRRTRTTPTLASLLAILCIRVPLAVLCILLPLTAAAQSNDGAILSRETLTLPDDAPEAARAAMDGVTLERVIYASDGLEVEGFLAQPAAEGSEKLPCVIYNRGGNRNFGALTPVRADTSRMGIFGWSRGGMMTYLALKATDRFKAAIVGGGLADMAEGMDARPDMEKYVYSELIPGWSDPAKRAAAIEARSAIRWVDELPATTPILLLQGTADWRVNPTQSLAMAESLQAKRHPYRLVMFEGGDHGLSEYRDEVNRAVTDWLDRYVRDGKSWPSLEPHGR